MRAQRREIILLLVLAVAAALLWLHIWRGTQQALVVTFLDVGQGDATLIRAPSGRSVLIDGGGRAGTSAGASHVGTRILLPALLASGVRRLDAVVLTHAHDDHVGGLPDVLEQVPVGMILDPQMKHPTASYRNFTQTAEKNRIPVKRAVAGQALNLGGGAVAHVLHPGPQRLVGTSDDLNNNSVVIRLTHGRISFLLPGDLDAEGEEFLLAHTGDLASTVLKVPHHGSDAGTTMAFLRAVKPAVAVISVGRGNPFDLPDPDTLERLKVAGARILRTDVDGAVTITTNGETWQVSTHRR